MRDGCGCGSSGSGNHAGIKGTEEDETIIKWRLGFMSYADKVFIDMCRDIIDNGTSTEGRRSARYGRTEPAPILLRNSVL